MSLPPSWEDLGKEVVDVLLVARLAAPPTFTPDVLSELARQVAGHHWCNVVAWLEGQGHLQARQREGSWIWWVTPQGQAWISTPPASGTPNPMPSPSRPASPATRMKR